MDTGRKSNVCRNFRRCFESFTYFEFTALVSTGRDPIRSQTLFKVIFRKTMPVVGIIYKCFY